MVDIKDENKNCEYVWIIFYGNAQKKYEKYTLRKEKNYNAKVKNNKEIVV